ncbi:unnamed protein product [Echinostoma caproni]|uniref:Cyclic nucleotide-binding domain-containing protein n=1 Tax=Echinostoma caproni TaxID=27848 RepID=A0A183A6T5_9TREM|nr:unnamed protein product [Echinostoma caproni]
MMLHIFNEKRKLHKKAVSDSVRCVMHPDESFPERLASILKKSHELRRDTEAAEVAKWLKGRVTAFKTVSVDVLTRLVRECEIETRKPYELIIREGDAADRMYILLSGSASVHQIGVSGRETDDQWIRETDPNPVTVCGGKTDEAQSEKSMEQERAITTVRNLDDLGPRVSLLTSGAIFGEVALIEACRRTASIVALPSNDDNNGEMCSRRPRTHYSTDSSNESKADPLVFKQLTTTSDVDNCDDDDNDNDDEDRENHAEDCVQLVVISRTLYDKTVRTVIQEQFQFRITFINHLPYFSQLTPRTKEQIAFGLETETYPLGSAIVHQGSPFKGLYYLIRSQSCDPTEILMKQLLLERNYTQQLDIDVALFLNRLSKEDRESCWYPKEEPGTSNQNQVSDK